MDNGVDASIWLWIAFNVGVLALIALDLGVFHRDAHAVTVKEAAIWSTVWVTLSLIFNAGIFIFAGSDPGFAFLTGYLIEKSLSIDNIFVFVLLFSFFAVPPAYQHRVLFWGIIGALIMRGAMIGAGTVLLHQLEWVVYVFGAVLILSGIRMAMHGDNEIQPERNPMIRMLRRVMPVSPNYEGQKFFTRIDGKFAATPLLMVLLVIDTADVIFAIDSIPAIFAVTRDPFLVYTSNVCAILGLRAMYFLLAGVVDKFHYLSLGLSAVLIWVGIKMMIAEFYHVPIPLSLGVIALFMTVAIGASLLFPKKNPVLEELEEGVGTGHH